MALKQKGTDAAAADPKKRRRVGFSGTGTKLDPRITLSFPAIRASGGESGAAGPIRVVTRRLSCWAAACVHFYVYFWPGGLRWGRPAMDIRVERDQDRCASH